MTRNQWKVAGLLFFSGFCALIYQTVWLRQFRLIFGASTFATGAVLAIFMAGLGVGSALLGKRADAKLRPLAWYARLELLIAASAALSPLLLKLVAKIYFASGGSPALGIGVATVLRLALSLLVLGAATVLMGGTLPAAARAVETDDVDGRRGVALLYGVSTLGAVAGALLSTFVLLEHLGNTKTPQSFSSPTQPAKIPMILMARAQEKDATVEPMLHQVSERQPIEATVILAALRAKQGEFDRAAELLHSSFIAYRKDPWPDPQVMAEAVELSMRVAATGPRRALMLREGLSQPFVVGLQNARRRFALMLISDALDQCGEKTVEVIRQNEPFPYWTHDMLRLRARCYLAAGLDLAPAALRDVQEFSDSEPASIVPPTH